MLGLLLLSDFKELDFLGLSFFGECNSFISIFLTVEVIDCEENDDVSRIVSCTSLAENLFLTLPDLVTCFPAILLVENRYLFILFDIVAMRLSRPFRLSESFDN